MGPRAVDAGECDRCGEAPRFVPTCGPAGAEVVCRDCALAGGLDLWCAGHVDTGEQVLAALPRLPDEWAVVTRLWWVATGEVRLDRLVLAGDPRLPPPVRTALAPGGENDPSTAKTSPVPRSPESPL